MGNHSSSNRRQSRVQQSPGSGTNSTSPLYPAPNSTSAPGLYGADGHLISYNVQMPLGGQAYQPLYIPRNGRFFVNRGGDDLRPPRVTYIPEHQTAITVRNNVNLKKSTLRLEKDEENPGFHLLAFTFDAALPGRISIFFFAKEGVNRSITCLKPQLYNPIQVKFDKGLGQKFRQAPGTGVNLSLFNEDDLVHEGLDGVFSLIVCADTAPEDPPPPTHANKDEPAGAMSLKSFLSQTTYAVLQKNGDEDCHVKVLRQVVWVDGMCYELQDIYGIANSSCGDEIDGNDAGKECIICMSEPKDTTLLPCRHMCLCSNCAKALRYQTNHCPICRNPVERLLEIRVPKMGGKSENQPVDANSLDTGGASNEGL